MSDKPEQPGKSLILYAGQAGTGEHDHLVGAMPGYPGGLARAHDMKLVVSIPPSGQEESVFTDWNTDATRTNALVLSKWLLQFCMPHTHRPQSNSTPAVVSDFYGKLVTLQKAFGRASQLPTDMLRDFFPADFKMALACVPIGQDGHERDPHLMKSDLEQLKKVLEKLANFPAPKHSQPVHRRGIDEFRQLVRSHLIAQVDRAIHAEDVLLERLEGQLPHGESFEAGTYQRTVAQAVGTWLDTVSQRPSSGRKRGK